MAYLSCLVQAKNRNWGCGGMVDATDLKSVIRNGCASSSLATPILTELNMVGASANYWC